MPSSPSRPGNRRAATIGLLALCAVVGCGGRGGGDDAGTAGEAPPGDALVVADGLAFTPEALDVAVGRDVTVVLEVADEAQFHNIHFPDLAGDPKTRLVKGPVYQTLTVRFDGPGEYRYVCDLHPTMRGVATAS